MKKDLAKTIAAVLAGGVIVAGGGAIINNEPCDFIIENEPENICITKEVKEAIESQLEENRGFGGVKLGG